jgi:hypothetical protein
VAKLANIIEQIDSGTMLLPEFQRGYVWNRDQVRGLMKSLYSGNPVGSLLVWETETEDAAVRGTGYAVSGVKQLLLDGQQRVTTLYGVVRGKPPAFFEGNSAAFTSLHFNVAHETFEFYAPVKMKEDPRWIDVTLLFVEGLEPLIGRLTAHPETQPDFAKFMARLVRLHALLEREFHVERIIGKDKRVNDVVEIFNQVNSGGTKLSKGDLALAKICAGWPTARLAMRDQLKDWTKKGYDFNLDWLLRNANAVATSRALFSALEDVSAAEFEKALKESVGYIGAFLDAAAGRLGLDHARVLMGRFAFPVVSLFLHQNGGKFADAAERDRMLFWYVHAGIWGRFAGSTETFLAQDYETLKRSGIDGLISSLERWRGGNLIIGDYDFEGATLGNRFYPLLYLLTRVRGARDFGSGIALHSEMLGHLSSLEVHHIFPKAKLRDHGGYTQNQINAVANFCFLTKKSNLEISDRSPQKYLAACEQQFPGVLASQWIPDDPALWQIDRYPDFLAARRKLLAEAANSFLTELRTGAAGATAPTLERITVTAPDEVDDARVALITSAVDQLIELGCSRPALDEEITDPTTGNALAIAEAYWADGIQTGQGEPVVLEMDPEESDLARLEELGYKVFTSVDALLGFARRRNEAAAGIPETMDEPAYKDAEEPEGDLQAEFHHSMVDTYERAKSEAGYNSTTLLRMISEHGGVEAAKRIIAIPHISEGFSALWERGRLDLSVEAQMIDPRFAQLFTDKEIDTARRWLEQFSYRA